VVESLCVTILPTIITICKDTYPNIELVVKIATTTKLLDMLNSNEVDMALTLDKKPDNSNFITVVERSDTTHFVAGPLSPLINKKNLSILDIMDETLIMPEQECNCRQLLREKLAEFNKKIKPNVLLEIGNTEIIKSFVQKNLAISMLPKITITEEIKTGTIATLDIVYFEIDIWIQLLYHKSKYLSPAMNSVLTIINETIISYFE
jgi:DNA-binding transcriptional LysR family regulator